MPMRYYDSSEMFQFMVMQNQNGGGGSLATIAILLGFFIAVFYKREYVTSWVMFRIATIFLALSFVLSPIVLAITIPIMRFGLGGDLGGFEMLIVNGLISCVGPGANAFCLLCLFSSVMPPLTSTRINSQPQKHPLDE